MGEPPARTQELTEGDVTVGQLQGGVEGGGEVGASVVDGVEGVGAGLLSQLAVVGFGGLGLAAQALLWGNLQPLGGALEPGGDDRAIAAGIFNGTEVGTGDGGRGGAVCAIVAVAEDLGTGQGADAEAIAEDPHPRPLSQGGRGGIGLFSLSSLLCPLSSPNR